ncbi:MAG TPA: hypothetical protein VF916_10685 [Ktedonobacterales bacterium]
MAQTATARAVDHAEEHLRALERAVKASVVVLERGTLADGVRFVLTSSASRPGATHTVRAVARRISCDCASHRDRLCTHRALAQAEWAADEAERTGEQCGWHPTPKGRALAIFDDQRERWAREECWQAFWTTL